MIGQIVYKYRVTVGETTHVPWGIGSRVTGLWADSPDSLTFWVVHKLPMPPCTRRFTIVGTGMEFHDYQVVGTDRHHDSGLVWHLVGNPW